MYWLISLATVAVVAVGTGFTTAMTLTPLGVDGLEHPEGITLRQESANRSGGTGFFLMYYSSRGHFGGGLSGGK